MAKSIKELEAQTDARFATVEEKLDQIIAAMATGKDAPKADQPKPKKAERPWWGEFPEYGTAAQKVEWDKLVERAKKQRPDMLKALGTESVKCFIPVPQQVDRMPHSIRWTGSYSS